MRLRLVWLLIGMGLSLCARAQSELVMGVSEGTSGGLDHGRVIAKYGPLADVIARALKRKVQVVLAREFAQLEEGMRSGRFDLVMARPSDYPARGVRDYGYRFVASARPDGHCLIVARSDGPLRSIAQARGQRWAMPEKVSYMAKFCTAEIRDQGISLDKERVLSVREQGAVNFYIQNGFADVGTIASYSGAAKSLEKDGLRVIHRSVAQPYFPLIAGPRITAEQVRTIQAELARLESVDSGQAVLKQIGVQAFDVTSGERLMALLRWLGL